MAKWQDVTVTLRVPVVTDAETHERALRRYLEDYGSIRRYASKPVPTGQCAACERVQPADALVYHRRYDWRVCARCFRETGGQVKGKVNSNG